MSALSGARIAILGAGRSGISAAKAAQFAGALPVILDERKAGDWARDEAVHQNIPLKEDYSGRDWKEFDLMVVSPGVPPTSETLQSAERSGLPVLSEIELAYRVARAPIVALTGTNGKSTTTVMAYLCARSVELNPILCGNIYGSGYPEVPLTDAAIQASADQLLVAEVSSYQLERVEQFRPISAGITNIWPDHLDRYQGQFSLYAAAKHNIFRALQPSDYAVIRAYDPVVVAPKGPKVLTFGAGGEHAQVTEDSITILGRKISTPELTFEEPHNLQNAAMAALLIYGAMRHRRDQGHEPETALLNAAEVDARTALESKRSVFRRDPVQTPWALPEAVALGLKEFKGLSHRMQLVGERGGIKVINNSMCTNVDAVLKSAQAIREPKHLLIGGVNKGLDFKPLKNYFSNGQNWAYVYGRDRASLGDMIGEVPTFETMAEAFALATERAKPGQVIMLSPGCASQDQFTDFRERGDVFTQMAKEWLES